MNVNLDKELENLKAQFQKEQEAYEHDVERLKVSIF